MFPSVERERNKKERREGKERKQRNQREGRKGEGIDHPSFTHKKGQKLEPERAQLLDQIEESLKVCLASVSHIKKHKDLFNEIEVSILIGDLQNTLDLIGKAFELATGNPVEN